MEEKKNEKKKPLQMAPQGLEPAPQFPPAQIVRPRTTSLIALKYSFSAIHTV